MPTYLFYPRRADGVSLTFIAEAAENDLDALELAGEIAGSHDCSGVFVWQPAATAADNDRFVGEVDRRGQELLNGPRPETGAEATL